MKWLQVLLFNTNNSINAIHSFAQSNISKYYYVISIIQFSHTDKKFQILLFNTNNSIQQKSFVFTQLNGSKYCYVSLTIQ